MKYTLGMTLILGAVLGCSADAPRPAPQREEPFDDDPRPARESQFWEQMRVHGDWVEYKPTLSELVDSADAAVVARLIAVEAGRAVQGDASEDLYTELLVNAEVTEVLRDSTTQTSVSFSLPLLGVSTLEEREDTLAAAQAALPIDQVLLILRQRDDEDYYSVVNGYGIWASTTRSSIDAPLELEAPLSGAEPFVYERELRGLENIEQLIESLR